MKYFLVLGLEFKFFKNPANITVHMGDKFIDTFQLDHDHKLATDTISHIEKRWYTKHNKEHWLTRADWVQQFNDIPTMYKVYELDDSAIQGKLILEVANSNNNFTNGFMTDSSMIRFPITALFNKQLVENRGEHMMEIFAKFHERDMKYPNSSRYAENDTIIQRWPMPHSFWVERKNNTFEKSGIKDHTSWLGGNFRAEFRIDLKHRTKYLADAMKSRRFGYPGPCNAKDLVLCSCRQLLNIYNEDQ